MNNSESKVPGRIDKAVLYQMALAEHKHYDNISLAACTGIVLAPGASLHLVAGKPTEFSLVMLTATMFAVILLFIVYRRMAGFASVARQVAIDMENGSCVHAGVSGALIIKNPVYGRTYGIMTIVMCGVEIIIAVFILMTANGVYKL